MKLAAMYRTDVDALSTTGRLLPLVAVRASDAELQRWAAAFGTMSVYEAIARFAPDKLPGFERRAAGRVLPGALNQTFQPNVDMSLMRIRQGFRSAPIGASSSAASIYQTSAFAGSHLTSAFGIGYAVGTGISYLLTNYAPSVNEAIGGTPSVMLEKLSGLTGVSISRAQEQAAYDCQLTDYVAIFEKSGGDYGAVEEWSVAAGYGGSGC